MIGESSMGKENTIRWASTVTDKNKYLIQFGENDAAAYNSIEDFSLDAPYCLDFRKRGSAVSPSNCYVSRCYFQTSDTDVGIGINVSNHDFSVIKECSFASYKGYCAIKVTGAHNGTKASTQIKILDCNIGYITKIGISLEYIATSTIRGNDFSGNSLGSIDLGGRLFWDNITFNPNLAYLEGSANYEDCVGWFKNITIENNHFEYFKNAIYVDGRSTKGIEGNGVYILNNNFMQGNKGPEISYMAKIKEVLGVHTENNNMNYWNDSVPPIGGLYTNRKCYGIFTYSCQNASFENDIFYSSAGDSTQTFLEGNYSPIKPAPWGIDYIDSLGLTYANIIKGGHGGIENVGSSKPIKDIIYNYTRLNLLNNSSINSSIPASNILPKQNICLMKTISNSGAGRLVLMDSVSVRTCGTMYLSVRIPGCSDFLTVRNISFVNCSGLVITKASSETDGNWYRIAYENNQIVFYPLQQFSQTNCSVSGYFTGMSD